MSLVCPQGHTSQATDYCDTCGSPMRPAAGGDTPAPAHAAPGAGSGGSGSGGDGVGSGGAGSGSAGSAEAPTPPAAGAQVCPNCDTPNMPDALFCEACGYDFTTGVMPRPVALTDGSYIGGVDPTRASPVLEVEPAGDESDADEGAAPESGAEESGAAASGAAASGAEEPAVEQAAAEEQAAEQPSVKEPSLKESSAEEPAAEAAGPTGGAGDADDIGRKPASGSGSGAGSGPDSGLDSGSGSGSRTGLDAGSGPESGDGAGSRGDAADAAHASDPAQAPEPAQAPDPAEAANPARASAAPPASDSPQPPRASSSSPSTPSAGSPGAPVPSASKRMANRPPSRVTVKDWVVEIWIDPDWYAVQESPEPCPSPGVPDIVALHDGALVGRPSSSRNVRPDIDCGTDTGASRRQALLTTDGRRWWIEDLGSSNGTYVGPASGPLPVDPISSKVEVDADDRIYVGAWTRLVVRPATDSERAGLG